MNYTKGQDITVRDDRGNAFDMRVWEDSGASVYVASDQVYKELTGGSKSVWPIGMPRSSITTKTQ